MENKITKREKLLSKLKARNVLIPDEHMDEIILAETEFNLSTMINKYKDRFLFPLRPKYFKKGVCLLSIIQIAKFDHNLSCFLNCEISKIEKDLTNILVEQINTYLNTRIFSDKQEDELNELDLPIKELIKGDNRKIFLRLFNKQESKIRKIIFNFLEYIGNNKEAIDTKLSVSELFSSFNCSKQSNDKKLKNAEKIINDILTKVTEDSNLSNTETLLGFRLISKNFMNSMKNIVLIVFLKNLQII